MMGAPKYRPSITPSAASNARAWPSGDMENIGAGAGVDLAVKDGSREIPLRRAPHVLPHVFT